VTWFGVALNASCCDVSIGDDGEDEKGADGSTFKELSRPLRNRSSYSVSLTEERGQPCQQAKDSEDQWDVHRDIEAMRSFKPYYQALSMAVHFVVACYGTSVM
jgi:hypothetical protein